MNNLTLNIDKTKELVIDFRTHGAELAPLHVNGIRVERVSSFKFLGVQISEDLTWTANTTALVKKAQQWMHFLRLPRKNGLNQQLLVAFYHSTIECAGAVHLSVVLWLFSCRQKSSAEGDKYGGENHRLHSAHTGGYLYLPLPPQSWENFKGLFTPRPRSVLSSALWQDIEKPQITDQQT